MSYFWNQETDDPTGRGIATAIGAVILFIWLFIATISGLARCGPGDACVVRNGGPLDNKEIRKTMTPGGFFQPVGFFSQIRHYRSKDNQSQYRITAVEGEGDKEGVDFVEVPTKDGVLVRLEATTFFTTAFTGEPDDELLRDFDVRFGNRTFKGKKVWEGVDGYAAWQDIVFRPLLNNAIRKTILTFDCSDLISSCALVRSSTTAGDISKLTEGQDNSRNFDRVGEAIASRLRENITGSLRSGEGEAFLINITFKLEDVKLPSKIQGQVNNAQESNVKIATARAEEQASKLEAVKNRRLAASLRQSPELKEVRVAEIYAKSKNPHLTIIQGGATPLIQTGRP